MSGELQYALRTLVLTGLIVHQANIITCGGQPTLHFSANVHSSIRHISHSSRRRLGPH